MLGGYEWARAEHFILTLLFTFFFVVHVVQVIIAGWNNFRAMVTGFEVYPVTPAQPVVDENNTDTNIEPVLTPAN